MDEKDESLLRQMGFPEVDTPKLTQEMKDWFSDGEYDVDLMLRMGVVTEDQIIAMWDGREDGDDN